MIQLSENKKRLNSQNKWHYIVQKVGFSKELFLLLKQGYIKLIKSDKDKNKQTKKVSTKKKMKRCKHQISILD